jgi:hypothetical protein
MSKRKPLHLLSIEPDTLLQDAEDLRRTDNSSDFPQAILTAQEFMGIKMPERKFLLKGLIAEESITVVNGFRGCGKSWLMMCVGDVVSRGKGQVGRWTAEKSVNVMLIDGEMPLTILQERLSMLKDGNRSSELFLYLESYAYRIGLKRANIMDPKWRAQVLEAVEMLSIKLLILDNLSSLAPGIDENEKLAFDPVNRWMLELRFKGVAIIMTHHTGKSGDQRGTSAHEDHADLCLVLKRPKKKQDWGCAFTVTATKDRAYVTEGKEMTLTLREVNGKKEFVEEEEEEKEPEPVKVKKVKEEKEPGDISEARRVVAGNPGYPYGEAMKRGISKRAWERAVTEAQTDLAMSIKETIENSPGRGALKMG